MNVVKLSTQIRENADNICATRSQQNALTAETSDFVISSHPLYAIFIRINWSHFSPVTATIKCHPNTFVKSEKGWRKGLMLCAVIFISNLEYLQATASEVNFNCKLGSVGIFVRRSFITNGHDIEHNVRSPFDVATKSIGSVDSWIKQLIVNLSIQPRKVKFFYRLKVTMLFTVMYYS